MCTCICTCMHMYAHESPPCCQGRVYRLLASSDLCGYDTFKIALERARSQAPNVQAPALLDDSTTACTFTLRCSALHPAPTFRITVQTLNHFTGHTQRGREHVLQKFSALHAVVCAKWGQQSTQQCWSACAHAA
jgi:hypothetical protein